MSSNPLKEKITKIAKDMINGIAKPQKGVVLWYSNKHNYATVEIPDPFGGTGTRVLEAVPVQILGGMHTPGPFEGDEVWVDFTNGQIQFPKIVAFADRNYFGNQREKRMKHGKKGAFIPNTLSKRVK